MKNIAVPLILAVAFILLVFLGAGMTGLIIYKTEYNELCKEDSNCPSGKCCIIYEDKQLGLCMENCRSFNFLCKSDEECELGTVCCIPQGKEYGICNYKGKCMNIDVFAEYVGRTTFADPEWLREQKSLVEKPMVIDSSQTIIAETVVIIGLLIFILYLILRKNKAKPGKRV